MKTNSFTIESLRTLSHNGIPEQLRSIVWKILLGYLPLEKDKQKSKILLLREEYFDLVDAVYPRIVENAVVGKEDELWDQIYVDVIRTFPSGMETFCEQQSVRTVLCRILYVYSVVHQRGNYWQGLNELPIPFMLSFAAFYANCSVRQLNTLTGDVLERIFSSGSLESDIYWCLCRFVQGLQAGGDFVVKKHGEVCQGAILQRFELLCRMVDNDLVENLKSKGVEFVFFAFRWMVCLLTREIPAGGVIRLWDSYLAEGEGILTFHLCTALSFLLAFSDEIKQQEDFEQTLTFLQKIPTEHWTELHAEFLVQCASQVKVIEKYYQDIASQALCMIVAALFATIAVFRFQTMISK